MSLRQLLGWSNGDVMRPESKPCSRLMRHTAGIFSVGGGLAFWVLCRLHYGPRITVPRSLSRDAREVVMQLTLRNWCLPCPLASDADAGDYEELPVSMPPHVPQGPSRDDVPGLDGWEEGAYAEAVEQLPAPDHHDGAEVTKTGGGGGAAGLWLRAAFGSVCRMVILSVTLCGHL